MQFWTVVLNVLYAMTVLLVDYFKIISLYLVEQLSPLVTKPSSFLSGHNGWRQLNVSWSEAIFLSDNNNIRIISGTCYALFQCKG